MATFKVLQRRAMQQARAQDQPPAASIPTRPVQGFKRARRPGLVRGIFTRGTPSR